jgi:integrase/recombinase XerD
VPLLKLHDLEHQKDRTQKHHFVVRILLTTHDNSTYHVAMERTLVAPETLVQRQASSDEQAVSLWLHGKSAHSRRAYAGDISRFLTCVSKPLPLVSLEDLQRFADSLVGLAPASQRRTLAAVKSLLAFCLKIGYTRFNVGGALTVRKTKNTIAERILPHEDITRIIELEGNKRNHAILRFLYESGCRVSELCGLKWRDIQPRENGLAQVTIFGKGDKTRHVLISKRLYGKLQKLRGDDGLDAPVFPTRTGGHLDQPAVFRIMQAAVRRAGIDQPISPHWFRHAAASHALDNGAPISLVKEQLGHASLETTSTYVHARPSDGLFKFLR